MKRPLMFALNFSLLAIIAGQLYSLADPTNCPASPGCGQAKGCTMAVAKGPYEICETIASPAGCCDWQKVQYSYSSSNGNTCPGVWRME